MFGRTRLVPKIFGGGTMPGFTTGAAAAVTQSLVFSPSSQFVNFGSTTVTFTSASVSLAAGERLAIVIAHNVGGSRNITGVTAAGNPTTQRVYTTGTERIGIWTISGAQASGDVVVTFNVATQLCE